MSIEGDRIEFVGLNSKRLTLGRMTAREWDRWGLLFRRVDPDGYAKYREEGRRETALDEARKHLSADDLKILLAEKLS